MQNIQKGLTDMCEAFLNGKEHTTWQAFWPVLILPLAVMLFVFPCFQCTEVKQPSFPSSPSCSMDGRLQDF